MIAIASTLKRTLSHTIQDTSEQKRPELLGNVTELSVEELKQVNGAWGGGCNCDDDYYYHHRHRNHYSRHNHRHNRRW